LEVDSEEEEEEEEVATEGATIGMAELRAGLEEEEAELN